MGNNTLVAAGRRSSFSLWVMLKHNLRNSDRPLLAV